jgi:hypothetical protein
MTNSAEQELEGTIWAAMTAHKVTTKEPLEFIETLKAAAMAYAAGDSDALTETRRMILHEATRPERIARARPPVGATLSTGHVVPPAGQTLANYHPQPVDDDLSHQQAARLLENLHERHTGKMTHR